MRSSVRQRKSLAPTEMRNLHIDSLHQLQALPGIDTIEGSFGGATDVDVETFKELATVFRISEPLPVFSRDSSNRFMSH